MSETVEQRRAIEARGNVLVSASAGAGKTSVMIKRLAGILEEGADLDDVLAVTFTKKAAAQMKDRLRRELISRLNGAEGARRENIRLQLNKINTADISTIHSFCARVVRTYFYALNIDASFDILADGAEEKCARERVMADLFEGLYRAGDPDFIYALSKLRKKRSDEFLKALLFEAYDKVRVQAGYRKLLSGFEGTFTEQGFERVCAELEKNIKDKCKLLINSLDGFIEDFEFFEGCEGYKNILGELRESISNFIACGSIFNPPVKLVYTQKPKVRPETAEFDASFVRLTDGVKKRFKHFFKDISSREEELKKFLSCGGLASAFTNLLLKFDEAYSGYKREEGKLDYGDLEHYAYELLYESEDGDIKEQLRSRYKYVFVDEYQDVNHIQDEIISAIAANDLFCVGDVKQAIYGFRGSRSDFFQAKTENVGEGGEYVVLPDNFRSAPAVIDFVNEVFADVMQPPLSKVNYCGGHAMRGGARYPAGCNGSAGIYTYDGAPKEKPTANGVYSVAASDLREKKFTNEGLAVLELVERALKGTYYDPDTNTQKRVCPGDICVLTRKRSNKSAQGILRAIGSKYSVAGAAEVNICDRPEIKQLLGILSYINNAEQDVPLAATMLSPVGKFTERELAAVREFGLGEEKLTFRECVKRYIEKNDDGLAARIREFFNRVAALRELSECIGAGRLIDEIILIDGFAEIYDTENKLIALRTLQREAYSSCGELSVAALLAKIKAGGYDVTAPAALASDCVKVMTMHASKGLEFPVVIVADIAVTFKGEDRSEMPFGAFGFAPKCFDEELRKYSGTLLRKLYKMQLDAEELENEINLFYVACTRAKYALYVVDGDCGVYDEVNAPYANSYAELFNAAKFKPANILIAPPPECPRQEGVRAVDTACLERLRRAALHKYGFELGVDLPVKSSASRLVAQNEPFEVLFEEDDGGEGGIEAGIAYHRFLELCDFTVTDVQGIKEELVRWKLEGLITEEQYKLLKVEELVKILAIPSIRAAAGKKNYREREFVCRLPSYDYLALKEGHSGALDACTDDGNGVIVQGALDLLCVELEGGKVVSAAITDYKYSVHSDGYLKEKYAPQLALYKSVVCAIYSLDKSKVKTSLINIRACREIDITV